MGPGRPVAPPQEGPQAARRDGRLEARPSLSSRERLPRSHRLSSGTDIRRVLATGRRSGRGHLEVVWAISDLSHPRLGVVVPRAGRTAVARNRMRRRLKELWRKELRHRLPPLDVVVRARPSAYSASYGELRAELLAWAGTLS